MAPESATMKPIANSKFDMSQFDHVKAPEVAQVLSMAHSVRKEYAVVVVPTCSPACANPACYEIKFARPDNGSSRIFWQEWWPLVSVITAWVSCQTAAKCTNAATPTKTCQMTCIEGYFLSSRKKTMPTTYVSPPTSSNGMTPAFITRLHDDM
mmetsp:Transcript_63315/g.177062  ORF Transcript_63315/g.177062 Transcript_63315/m.177062 type:complete len:153 (-) Transcript_63315:47-505(-)